MPAVLVREPGVVGDEKGKKVSISWVDDPVKWPRVGIGPDPDGRYTLYMVKEDGTLLLLGNGWKRWRRRPIPEELYNAAEDRADPGHMCQPFPNDPVRTVRLAEGIQGLIEGGMG